MASVGVSVVSMVGGGLLTLAGVGVVGMYNRAPVAAPVAAPVVEAPAPAPSDPQALLSQRKGRELIACRRQRARELCMRSAFDRVTGELYLGGLTSTLEALRMEDRASQIATLDRWIEGCVSGSDFRGARIELPAITKSHDYTADPVDPACE